MTEKNSADTTMTLQSDREIVVTRLYDAPRELVFKAYTDPTAIPLWWGPRKYVTTVDKMDVRVGGVWRYVQRDSEGHEYAFNGVYREIVPPERISFTFEFEGEPGHIVMDTVTFEDKDGKTLLTATSRFETAADRDGMINAGMESGMRDTMDRLGEYLLSEKTGQGREVVITRIFNAPRELVWKAWTDPEHIMNWWGPRDYTCPTFKIDLRVGGAYLFCMRSSEGQDIWATGVYREIVPPEKLVYTDSFADEKGNPVPGSHYGMGDDFPSELVVTLTFEEQDGKTKMTLRHGGLPAGEISDMTMVGWNESFDKLTESLVSEHGLK